MAQSFTRLDWLVIIAYLALLGFIGWWFSARKSENANEYFLGGNAMPAWLVAISVLATSQSAATFLGGPDQGFRGDFTYLSTNLGTIVAAVFVAAILIPRYYKLKVTTVYELLAHRFDENTMRAAGAMYLVGRIFASGSRLFLAAIAVSMILFSNIEPHSIIISSFLMMALGFLVTFLGGIKSVIWSDLIQFLIYFGAALIVLFILRASIPVDLGTIIDGLHTAPEAKDKLRLFNTGFNLKDPFTLISIFTGFTLLAIASFGMDQDMSQRILTCKSAKQGGKALVLASLITLPVVFVFIAIGELLHIVYERPELMNVGAAGAGGTGVLEFEGEKITVFMHYILGELPAGLKGLVTIGVVAAAVSTINSGLNSMASVMVEDFYRPWQHYKQRKRTEQHYVHAGQIAMGLVGMALFAMSVLCYYWQKYSDMPLLDFALSVMVFSYSGLLGVYFTVLFTKRGSPASVIAALMAGFLTTLLLQSYIVDLLHLPKNWGEIAFSWKLLIGTIIAFLVCILGKDKSSKQEIKP